jgi:hypothetical protein
MLAGELRGQGMLALVGLAFEANNLGIGICQRGLKLGVILKFFGSQRK